ncbi:MAG: hypothetical protein QOD74_900 [Variibacter sp.]|jgi:hypothetical protein|nr:hypothetical protein [Variibacter sp.]
MTLEQFFATHRAANAIVIPQADERSAPAAHKPHAPRRLRLVAVTDKH